MQACYNQFIPLGQDSVYHRLAIGHTVFLFCKPSPVQHFTQSHFHLLPGDSVAGRYAGNQALIGGKGIAMVLCDPVKIRHNVPEAGRKLAIFAGDFKGSGRGVPQGAAHGGAHTIDLHILPQVLHQIAHNRLEMPVPCEQNEIRWGFLFCRQPVYGVQHDNVGHVFDRLPVAFPFCFNDVIADRTDTGYLAGKAGMLEITKKGKALHLVNAIKLSAPKEPRYRAGR